MIQPGTASNYDRIAGIYDWLELPMELMGGRQRRRRVVQRASGRVLEVGIGTGRNLEHYGTVALTGIDVSARMLQRANTRAATPGREVVLEQGDVQALPGHAPDAFGRGHVAVGRHRACIERGPVATVAASLSFSPERSRGRGPRHLRSPACPGLHRAAP